MGGIVDWLLPSSPDEESALRSRFFVQTWLVGLVFGLITAVAYGASGLWGQVFLSVVTAGIGALLVLFHRASGRVNLASHLSLVFITAAFGLGVLAQSPPDPTNAAFLVVVPLLAGFQFGPRHALPWVFVAMIVAVGALFLANAGFALPTPDPQPVVSQSVNVAFMVALAWIISARFHAIRRAALDRVRAADQAKSMFLATVSHEIRTPMNGVLGMTEVMLTEARGERERAQLEVIHRSGRLLVSLINDLLDLTKLEANKLRIDEVDFDLAMVLDDVEVLSEASARDKHLTLRLELPPDVPRRLRGDALRLRQVLGNLVSNAVKFTETGGVTLAVQRVPAEEPHVAIRFEVTDTGIGIAPEKLSRLFAPFEQGDARTTRRFGGTGLGLALSQQLVTRLGGTIEADSKPGEGTRFWFTLCFKPALGTSSGFLSPPVVPKRTESSARVLVVDDNAVNLTIAAALVAKAGYGVQQASSGKEAVDIARRGECALVLMDCHMPEMDGFEATSQIRALGGPVGGVPIIALTASTTPEDFEACRRAGMNECLTKPISLSALSAVLERFAPGRADSAR